ncbi:unnamed protein product [Adineta steineri]|uniref:Uncharacterized protein n=2 Tax=Adineta steineri TaxID=433720 RepID=A0A815K065_9BILA|nr:unnamed protein product [Adineta steineri]
MGLNIFSLRDMGSSMDLITAKRLGQWATRLYIALFISGLSILTIYTIVQPHVVTKTFDTSSFSIYNDLQQKYGDELKCPCSVIASIYDKFVKIEPIFHEICSSPFASKQYRIDLTAGLMSNLSIYVSRDYRHFLSAHLQALQGLCQLFKTSVYDSINQFRTSLFVTSQLLSKINFDGQIGSLIEQTKSNAPTTLRRHLFLIQNINHGNAYMSTYGTNFEYIGAPNAPENTYLFTRATIYDGCSCGLYLNCTSQANFIESNSSKLIPVKGLKIGCTPSESFRASTLECFYDRSCIDLIHQYTNYTTFHNPLSFILHEIKQIDSTSISCICATNLDCQTEAVIYGNNPSVISYDDTNVIYKIPGFIRGCLNSDSLLQSTLRCLYPESNSDCFANLMTYTKTSYGTYNLNISEVDLHPLVYNPTRNRFPPNTLISIIFKEMMLEQWNSSWSYERFYESCAPKYCTYHQKIRSKTIVDILITLLSTIGGLAVSLRFITPHFVKFLFKLWAMIRKRKQEQQEHQGNH